VSDTINSVITIVVFPIRGSVTLLLNLSSITRKSPLLKTAMVTSLFDAFLKCQLTKSLASKTVFPKSSSKLVVPTHSSEKKNGIYLIIKLHRQNILNINKLLICTIYLALALYIYIPVKGDQKV